MTASFILSWILTFLLLYTQKQDRGTEDVDDADDPWGYQVSLFLRAEETSLARVTIVWIICLTFCKELKNTHRLL